MSKDKLDHFKKCPDKFTLEDGVRWYRNFANKEITIGSQYYGVPWITDGDLLTRVVDFSFFEKLKFRLINLLKCRLKS